MKKVEIFEENIQIPTYKLGPADSEATLEKEFTPRNSPIYPYSTQEVITEEKELKQYRSIILENDYLKLRFLPDIGGRLYSAYDKVNDSEMFYSNPVIKPGLFALRGAWPAVGVEFNFPNSHTTTTLEKICCNTKRYDDGSASVILGDIEWTGRMGWSVEINLHPEKAVIEMESKLYNPTDLLQRFYYWINAACPVYADTQFIYPHSTNRLYTHPPMDASRLGYVDYPIHEDVDISFFKNIKQHFPIFAEKMEEDFYGIYHHEHARGLVHVADHTLVRGRKLWMFGNARDGKIFIDMLSDTGEDYCELQTGPFSLQSDYRLLKPGRIYVQKDFWIPVANTKGFNLGTRDFVANIILKGKQANIKLYAATPLQDIKVIALSGSNVIDSKVFSTQTGDCIQIELAISENNEIHFLDATGRVLAEFTENIEFPVENEKDKEKIEKENYLKGKYLEEQGRSEDALRVYELDSKNNIESKISAARLMIGNGFYDDALSKLEEVLEIDQGNPEALIYYGRLLREQGNIHNAELVFSKAMDSNLFRDDALLETAVTSILTKNYFRAASFLEEILKYGAGNPRAIVLYALCKRKLGENNQEHINQAEHLFYYAPLLFGEKYFMEENSPVEFSENHEFILETTCEYIHLGEFEDAVKIISSQENIDRQGYYLLAWLKSLTEDEAGADEAIKSAQETEWKTWPVFRNEMERVLRFVLEKSPEDSTAGYQLGCLLAHNNRWEDALTFWEKTEGQEKVHALRNIGLCYWKKKTELSTAAEYYKKAVKFPNSGSRTLIEAELLLEKTCRHPERIELFNGKEEIIEKDSRLKLSMVKACLSNDMPEKAYSLLSNGNFCLCEGKMLSRILYEDACEKLAQKAFDCNQYEEAAEHYLKATEYPENIGIGKPSANKEAEWFFKAGKAYEKAKLEEKASDCFIKGAEKGDFLDIDFFPLKNMIWQADWEKIDVRYWKNLIFRGACLQIIEQQAEADKIFSRVKKYLDFLTETGRIDNPETVLLSTEMNNCLNS